MQLLCDYQDVYSQLNYGLGVADIFSITNKSDAAVNKQRFTNFPIHYRDQIQQILDDLEHTGIFERVGLNAARNIELGSQFLNPVIFLPKGDTHKKKF